METQNATAESAPHGICNTCKAKPALAWDCGECKACYLQCLVDVFRKRTGLGIQGVRQLIDERMKQGDWDTVVYYAQKLAKDGAGMLLQTWERISADPRSVQA